MSKSWQNDRGERYGNQRKQIAELKVKERRTKRAQNKQQLMKQLDEVEFYDEEALVPGIVYDAINSVKR